MPLSVISVREKAFLIFSFSIAFFQSHSKLCIATPAEQPAKFEQSSKQRFPGGCLAQRISKESRVAGTMNSTSLQGNAQKMHPKTLLVNKDCSGLIHER